MKDREDATIGYWTSAEQEPDDERLVIVRWDAQQTCLGYFGTDEHGGGFKRWRDEIGCQFADDPLEWMYWEKALGGLDILMGQRDRMEQEIASLGKTVTALRARLRETITEWRSMGEEKITAENAASVIASDLSLIYETQPQPNDSYMRQSAPPPATPKEGA